MIDFNVEGAVKEIREFRNLPDNLKILLFAHDNKMSIFKDDSIDWIGVIKRLMDQIEENEGLIIRVLRYLKCKYEETSGLMESVPLLLMNTFNKVTRQAQLNLTSFSFRCSQLPQTLQKTFYSFYRR